MNINEFVGGWLVGNFVPALVDTKDVGVGVLYLKAGDKGDGHWHEKHTEHNIIIQGEAKKDGIVYGKGDIFTYNKGEKSFVEYPVDTILLVIKDPSVHNDKFYES
jgi:hypothetical protein